MIFSLQPRLNYHFTIGDLVAGFYAVLSGKREYPQLIKVFPGKNIYYYNYGRTALREILRALNLKEGTGIGIQVLTCPTVFKTIKDLNLKPVFLDINDNFTLDIPDIERKKNDLEVIIATHTFGIQCDIKEIKKVLPGIPIIEDCAHSFFPLENGLHTGLDGDAAFFSFGSAKFPSAGIGGFALINHPDLEVNVARNYQLLKSPGFLNEMASMLVVFCKSLILNKPIYGFVKPLKRVNSEFKSSNKVLPKKTSLAFLNTFHRRFRNIHSLVQQQRENCMEIINTLPDSLRPVNQHLPGQNYFMIPLRIHNPNSFKKQLDKKGIETEAHFGKSIVKARNYGYQNTCPNTEKLIKEFICIPCHYRYPKKKIKLIKESLSSYANID